MNVNYEEITAKQCSWLEKNICLEEKVILDLGCGGGYAVRYIA